MYITVSVLLLVLASVSAFNPPRFGARAVRKMSLDMKNVRQLFAFVMLLFLMY